MKIFKAFVAATIILLLSSSAFAQADSATRQLLGEIAGKFESITSYTVDVAMETSMMGQPVTTRGAMSFKKPDKVRMKTTSDTMGGAGREIFASGGVVYTYTPVIKTATRMDMNRLKTGGRMPAGMSDHTNSAKPFAGFPQDGLQHIETRTTDGGEVYVFEARPQYDAKAELAGQMSQDMPTPDMFSDRIIFHVDAGTGLLKKMTVFDETGAVMLEQTHSNIRVNVAIDDSEFEFIPPGDVQIVDMTEGVLSMIR